MKEYKVILRFANYYFKTQFVRAESRLAAAIIARDKWNETHTTKCIIWAVRQERKLLNQTTIV